MVCEKQVEATFLAMLCGGHLETRPPYDIGSCARPDSQTGDGPRLRCTISE